MTKKQTDTHQDGETAAPESNRRRGGKMVHLSPDILDRVQKYKVKFEADFPGIEVTDGGILANLIHCGLKFAEHGPFCRTPVTVENVASAGLEDLRIKLDALEAGADEEKGEQ